MSINFFSTNNNYVVKRFIMYCKMKLKGNRSMKLVHVETILGKTTKFSSVVIVNCAVFLLLENGEYDSCNLSMVTTNKTASFSEALKESTSIPPLNKETLNVVINSLEKTITGVIVIVPENDDLKKRKEIVIK